MHFIVAAAHMSLTDMKPLFGHMASGILSLGIRVKKIKLC